MLEARSLTKHYNHITAVHGISFTIERGEILGYLGANGAGKSTIIKMLTGLIEPSEGQILYHGRSIYDDLVAFQRCIGYVPEEAHVYPHSPAVNICDWLAASEECCMKHSNQDGRISSPVWSLG